MRERGKHIPVLMAWIDEGKGARTLQAARRRSPGGGEALPGVGIRGGDGGFVEEPLGRWGENEI